MEKHKLWQLRKVLSITFFHCNERFKKLIWCYSCNHRLVLFISRRCLCWRLRQSSIPKTWMNHDQWWKLLVEKLSQFRLEHFSPQRAQNFPIKRENISTLESHKLRALFNASDPNKDEKNIFSGALFLLILVRVYFCPGSENWYVPQAPRVFLGDFYLLFLWWTQNSVFMFQQIPVCFTRKMLFSSSFSNERLKLFTK